MALEGLRLGQYRLLHLLGSGGMGEVYLAEDERISQQVAIKVNKSEVSSYPQSDMAKDVIRLFQREAKAIAKLDHPHILPLFGYGEELVKGMTLIYIVMPFRPEGSFADWLHQRNNDDLLSVQDVAYFINQTADALQYVHDNQIVHQDVKPSNFLIRTNKQNPNRPDLLLSDFGIAKLSSTTASISHSIRGTPAYMAPEIWSGQPVPASDQYALAVMAYELFTGHSPFTGRQEHIMYQHFNTTPQPLSTLNPALSTDIDFVLLKALEKNPADRFMSMAAFANALQQATQSYNASTIIRNPQTPSSTDLHVTLAISKLEAKKGTTRILTLQNGQQVTISVPADAHDGQVFPIEYGGQLSAIGTPIGRLMITLFVKDTDETFIPSNDRSLDETVPASHPHLPAKIVPPSTGDDNLQEVSKPNKNEVAPPVIERPTRRLRSFKSTAIIITLIALSLLVVSASIGFYFLHGINQPTSDNSKTVATVHAEDAASFAATATTQSNNAHANATTQAINATATSQTNNVNLTATALNANTFPPTGAALKLDDPLSNNDNGYNWETTPDAGGVCQFTGGAYQVSERANDTREYCPAYNTDFASNFAYEVQMTIVQGDQAGLIFQDVTHQVSYFWRFRQDGSYDLILYQTATSPTLAAGTASSFNTGYNQSNLLQIVVKDSSFQLFVNNQFVTRVGISSYGHGYIGVFVKDRGNPTVAIFRNAKVWKF